MYEENTEPLPAGDAATVFAAELSGMDGRRALHPDRVTPETVVRFEDPANQDRFAVICRRLLLPGSGIRGLANLRALVDLAQQGQACLLCLNHRSILDVPLLYTLVEDHADLELFRRLIWVSGRKLETDTGYTSLLVRCFNRIVVSPPSWFALRHTDDEVHEARRINIAAERAIARLRLEGWVTALFPAGTRIRPGDASSRLAIEQTLGYLKLFDRMVLCNIDGCVMPVSKRSDLAHETPRLDRVTFTFGRVVQTTQWIAEASRRYPELDTRHSAARAIMADIDALAPSGSIDTA